MCDVPGAGLTADLLDGLPGTVFTAGDNAYLLGTDQEFAQCYAPTWGRHRARTRPSPGNHDYGTPGASAYFAYFGENAGPAGLGYYSYTVGAWHVVSLNSNIDASAGSAQEEWLRADLAQTHAPCTLAYFHHPVFVSGRGVDPRMRDIWRALYDYRAEVVVSGHYHIYERFAPQDPDGRADPQRGIREFVVGTGGATLHALGAAAPNSELRDDSTWGVIEFTLHSESYQWRFVPARGGSFTDSGSAPCVK